MPTSDGGRSRSIGSWVRIAVIVIVVGSTIAGALSAADRDGEGAIVGAGDLAGDEIAVGDCIELPDASVEEFTTLLGVPCGDPHDAEVHHVYELADGDFPDDDTLFASVEDECLPAFDEYTGASFDESPELSIGWFAPTREAWDAGDRLINCYVYRTDESSLTGSVATG